MISIITPVYNAENYLKNYIESVLAQTYKDFELILINDCSTDKSLEICNYYKSIDSRIIVLCQQQNCGISKTRNLGLSQAKGEYIMFSDDDDYWPNNAIQILWENMNKYNSDIAIGGFYKVCNNVVKRKKFKAAKKIYTHENSIKYYLNYNTIYGFPWGKLYKKEILNNVKFPEDAVLGEDAIFTFETIMNSNNISFTRKPVYYYRVRKDSFSLHGGDINDREMTTLDQLNYIKKYINNPIVRKNYNIFSFELKYQILKKYIKSTESVKKKYHKDFIFIKEFLDNNWKYVFLKSNNLRIKIHAVNYFINTLGGKDEKI